MLAFSLGCMSFNSVEETPPTSDKEWSSSVLHALKGLASTSDVEVAVRGLPPASYSARREDWFDFADRPQTGPFRPHPRAGDIRFKIRIPQHLQNEVYPRGESRAGTEDFNVAIHYTSRFPVTVVWTEATDYSSRPQDAMIVVRQFLIRELRGRAPIDVGTIGPTPAWSDCYLDEGGPFPEGGLLEVDYKPGGYRHVFTYNTDVFSDDASALEELVAQLTPELAFYYDQQVRRNRRMYRATRVQDDARALTEMHSRTGISGTFKRVFRSGGLEREASLRLISALLAEDEDRRVADEWVPRIYAEDDLQAWRFYVEEVIAESFRPRLEHAQRILDLLGSRRTKEFEVSVVAASTLLGGVAGAAAALLAR